MGGMKQIWEQKGENVIELHTISVDKKKNNSNSLKSQFFLLLDATPIEIRGESTTEEGLNAIIVILDFIVTDNQE